MFIKELILETKFPNDLKYFYEYTLGLELTSENENEFQVQAGTTCLSFKNSTSDKDPFYHFAFNIPENQLKKAKVWAKERFELIELDGEDEYDFKSWNANSIFFYDPAGNILEFIARHNLKNSSGEEFSNKSILSISEIGLPVYDIESFYKEVNIDFNVPVFSSGGKVFCAAGDDSGLFIIVIDGRVWFPNCGKAEIFPTTVKIRSNYKREISFGKLPYKIISC